MSIYKLEETSLDQYECFFIVLVNAVLNRCLGVAD